MNFQMPPVRNQQEYNQYLRQYQTNLKYLIDNESQYAQANQLAFQMGDLKIPAPLPEMRYSTAEAILEDPTKVRELTIVVLRKLFPLPADANTALSMLSFEDMKLLNKFFGTFQKEIGDVQYLTPNFFIELWNRYKTKLISQQGGPIAYNSDVRAYADKKKDEIISYLNEMVLDPSVGNTLTSIINQFYYDDKLQFLDQMAKDIKQVANKKLDIKDFSDKYTELAKVEDLTNMMGKVKLEDDEETKDDDSGGALRRKMRGGMIKNMRGGMIQGLEYKPDPVKYFTFGKIKFNKQKFLKKNQIVIRTLNEHPIPGSPTMTISKELKKFLLEIIQDGKPDYSMLKNLSQVDIANLSNLLDKSKLTDQLGLGIWRDSLEMETDKEVDRFELLRGEVLAGNDSPELLKELRLMIVKFINVGKLRKQEGTDLLYTIACLS